MRTIALTQGKFALVDDEDYEWLMKWKWCYSKKGRTGYAVRGVDKKMEYMHRKILNLIKGDFTDHINGNGIDNRRSNLRKCTHRENLRNQRKIERIKGKKTSSKFKGVTWDFGVRKWRSQIGIRSGRSHYLGIFDSETEAAKRYDREARRLYGEFASCNFR